jgi:beta-lactamase superfamily II metal-dependent hydrolase
LKNCSIPINKPPTEDELEISLFGPGVGECIVAHIGNGQWVIIDSCTDNLSKEPIALQYLRQLGIDLAESVCLIVISHWHDDHIKGMAKLVSHCTKARIAHPQALLQKEFLTLVTTFNNPESIVDRGKNGVTEMANVIKEISKREAKNKGYIQSMLVPAGADRCFINEKHPEIGKIEVWSLSPSDASYNMALQNFARLYQDITNDEYLKVIPSQTPNKNAVVLLVSVGNITALLGADLEDGKCPYTGWTAILNSTGRPKQKSQIFKIPHHGSATAYNRNVWTDMLIPNSTAILTTYSRGKTPIPTQEQINLLKSHTNNLYLTSLPKTKKHKRNHTVEKMMKEIVEDRQIISGTMGHIQIRASKDNINVRCALPAYKIT